MTKEEFIAQLERASSTTPGLPVTTALLNCLASELKKGDPSWWKATAKAWEGRKFVAWTEAWGLFLTAVHYEVLSDADSPLVPYFPSCGGTPEADPSAAFLKFLAAAPASFYEHLKRGHRRTFVKLRAPLWMDPAALFFQRRDLPFYLVEVNAGAGLNLAADQIVKTKGFDSELIAARIGLDVKPLDIDDISDLRWLTAAVMTDQMPMISDLDQAVSLVKERRRQEAFFIQLVQCAPELAARFVAKNIPSDDADAGLLIYNMGTTVRMADADYAAYVKAMSQMMAPWQDRALWVEVENVRGELYSTTYQLRAHRWAQGQWTSRVLASFDFAHKKIELNQAENAQFLT